MWSRHLSWRFVCTSVRRAVQAPQCRQYYTFRISFEGGLWRRQGWDCTMTPFTQEYRMSDNDILALNTEYSNWLSQRAEGLTEFDPEIAPFEFFCAEQFLKSHILLSDHDILSGIVGKSDDGGVDSFYFIVDGQLVKDDTTLPSQPRQVVHLVLIQSKENKGFAPTSVDKFDTFTDDLLDLGKTSDRNGRKYHAKLSDMMRTFKTKYLQLSMPQTTVDYYYIARADVLENEGCDRAARK